jgi:hypothetical protein
MLDRRFTNTVELPARYMAGKYTFQMQRVKEFTLSMEMLQLQSPQVCSRYPLDASWDEMSNE